MNLINVFNVLNDVCTYHKNDEGIELTNSSLHSDNGDRYKFKNPTEENDSDRFVIIASGNFTSDAPIENTIAMYILQKEGTDHKYEISRQNFNSHLVLALD